ncbi:MAG TPA: GxxExxY protein [Kiritimatiellia bacterium]|nr:GxxExxY protein [Kiritimatiellia bacterium]HPS09108.1 GxxExxY protein [Kiritimatiellia bacterium]
MRDVDEVAGQIVDAAIKVRQALGPGLLESVDETVLAHELTKRGLKVERQESVRFEYDGLVFEEGLHRIGNQYISSAPPRLRVNQTATQESQ